MRSESAPYLREIEETLSNRGIFEPDRILETVTEVLEHSGDIKYEPLRIRKIDGDGLEVIVGNEGSLNLANFLPADMRFVTGPDFAINKETKKLYIPTNKKEASKPLSFRIKLAHEIGHGLDPDYEDLDSLCREGGASVEELVQQENARLRLEVNAWSYGKAVADVMGIEDLNYEDIMHHALVWYEMAALEKIIMGVHEQDVDPQSVISFYNPIIQGEEELTFEALIKRIDEFYENNRMFTAAEEFKRVAQR